MGRQAYGSEYGKRPKVKFNFGSDSETMDASTRQSLAEWERDWNAQQTAEGEQIKCS